VSFRGRGNGSEVCSEGGGKEGSQFSDLVQTQISRFRSGSFGFTRLHLKFAFASQPLRQGPPAPQRGAGAAGRVGTISPSSRFVDCSVRALWIHKVCSFHFFFSAQFGFSQFLFNFFYFFLNIFPHNSTSIRLGDMCDTCALPALAQLRQSRLNLKSRLKV